MRGELRWRRSGQQCRGGNYQQRAFLSILLRRATVAGGKTGGAALGRVRNASSVVRLLAITTLAITTIGSGSENALPKGMRHITSQKELSLLLLVLGGREKCAVGETLGGPTSTSR